MFMRTIRATRVARLCQLRCINNAIKPINTCHSRDRISCPRRPLHPSARHQKRCSPLHAKARRWKASNPEPAHRAHSDAEKHSIVLLTVSGTLIRAIAGKIGHFQGFQTSKNGLLRAGFSLPKSEIHPGFSPLSAKCLCGSVV